jgi:hypothetical protein
MRWAMAAGMAVVLIGCAPTPRDVLPHVQREYQLGRQFAPYEEAEKAAHIARVRQRLRALEVERAPRGALDVDPDVWSAFQVEWDQEETALRNELRRLR